MSAELLVITIGTVMLLLAVIDILRSDASSYSLINTKLRIPMGVVGILLIMYGGFSYGAMNLTGQIEQPVKGNIKKVNYPVNKVMVISPIDGDSVNCRILTMGVYPDGHEKDIWVVLKPSDNKYYPQSDHTNTSYKRKGEWQVITRFGGDEGEAFDIMVYEADADASEFFSKTIAGWNTERLYPGLEIEDMPDGAVEVDKLTVLMQENCRGVH